MTAMHSRSTRTTGRSSIAVEVAPRASKRRGTVASVEPPLARCGPNELALAMHLRDVLLLRARTLAAALTHGPDLADCSEAGCGLSSDLDPRRCALVHRLAAIEGGVNAHGPRTPPPDPACHGPIGNELRHATSEFETALTDALDAVRRCRQTEHGSGQCWFSASPGIDGCGEVLRAAHRLG
jgi:hypothetical protein